METETFNICKFAPPGLESENIHVLNFVCENDFSTPNFVTFSYYRLYVVAEGKGVFDTKYRKKSIGKGDVFVTEPSTCYTVTDEGSLKMYYVSFVGLSINSVLARVGYDKSSHFIGNAEELLPLWTSALKKANESNIDLIGEGILRYTLGFLCKNQNVGRSLKHENHVLKIRKLIDERFADPDLSLKSLCEELYLSPKYASRIFAEKMNVTFSEYLSLVRIENSVKLIENGFTSIKEIASLSGYTDTSYFARAFKKTNKISPTQYIKNYSLRKSTAE